MKIEDIISNVKIYDLEESLRASGYPMKTELDNDEDFEKDLIRGSKLVRAASVDTDAHAQFLTGIRVNFDLTFTNKAWVEAERYRFLEFVSSQSTMHRIIKFDLNKQYIEYVDERIIEIIKEKVHLYNMLFNYEKTVDIIKTLEYLYLEILYSNPCGFRLTARMTTNYRCLKNIYKQRCNHKLPEWKIFCKWIETLPYAKELLGIKGDKNEIIKGNN